MAVTRIDNDAYNTPASCVDAILPWIDFTGGPTFLEPCRGRGNIYNAIAPMSRSPHWYEIADGRDYLEQSPARHELIVTNPPFNLALEFLEKSLAQSDTCIYLLRVAFLASERRRAFWRRNPPTHLFFLSDRPSFMWVCSNRECSAYYEPDRVEPCDACGSRVRRQTDHHDYAWFAWDHGNRIKTQTVLNWL